MRSGSWAIALLLALVPGVSHAQPRVDLAGTTGFFFGHAPSTDVPGSYDDWFDTGLGGVQVGWYFNPHLKFEVDALATGGGSQHVVRYLTVPGLPRQVPIGAEATTTLRSVGAALTWQFRDNEWVHPFVQAGVAADFERRSVRTFQQFFYPGVERGTPPVVLPGNLETVTGTNAKLLLGGGAKWYVAPRAFIRTDARVTVGSGRQNVALRAGFGVDF